MATRDLYNNIGVVHLLDAQDVTNTDTKTSILDLYGFEGAVLSVNVGAITTPGAAAYLTPILQHSDTTADTAFAAVDAADVIGAFTKIDAATEDQVTQSVGYIGSKRYVRVLLDFTDASNGISACLVSVDGIVGIPQSAPVTAPAAVAAT